MGKGHPHARGLPAKYLFDRASLAALPDGGLVLADKIKLETGGTRDAAIGERGSQDRLLLETLKPVFSG